MIDARGNGSATKLTRCARRIIKVVALAAMMVVAGFMVRWCYRYVRGIEVCLRNVDSQPLRAGEVAVRSGLSTRRFGIGDLEPDASACVWVKADNDASVDVTFARPSASPIVIPLDGYIEPENRGSISADVTSKGARSIRRDIEPF